MATAMNTDHSPPDLSACEREPLRTPGAIQSDGVLLSFQASAGWTLTAASDNVAVLYGKGAEDLIGHPLRMFFSSDITEKLIQFIRSGVTVPLSVDAMFPAAKSDESVHTSRKRKTGPLSQTSTSTNLSSPPLLFGTEFDPETHYFTASTASPVNQIAMDVVAHITGDHLMVELVPAAVNGSVQTDRRWTPQVLAIELHRLHTEVFQKSTNVYECGRKLADHLSKVTGYDRVMVYRYARIWMVLLHFRRSLSVSQFLPDRYAIRVQCSHVEFARVSRSGSTRCPVPTVRS